ncbi:arylsulfatase B [Anabrus simplex]|uniref:arylsulfatase B n=1 Tax=Anabrus simplex TaxID=316456 RepID=UPI0035A26BF7
MGWNDVSFHGSDQIPTPNIDALAYSGVILNSHYAQPLCSPSRAALLTGKYPLHNGMQHNVILEAEPWGLPLTEKLLPQYLQELGYTTHAVGKWHLGFFHKEYTPTYRGFDSFFGFWNGYEDYYSHITMESACGVILEGYDMRRNLSVDYSSMGKYSTQLFTDEAVSIINRHDTKTGPLFLYLSHPAPHAGNYEEPLQAPEEDIHKFEYIQDPERRIYAAMVSQLDRSVGAVLTALRSNGMLDDSIILFSSDNGAITEGIHANRGSNWPLRGMKGSPWEGAIRTVACIWSNKLTHPRTVSHQLVHITDWMPTLYSAAGGDVSKLGQLDGVDQWKSFSQKATPPRSELLINIDDVSGYAALRVDHLKYINGTTLLGFQDGWYGVSGTPDPEQPEYDPEDVLSSPAGKAFKMVIDAENLLQIREEATVRCSDSDPESSVPCKPQLTPCLFDVVRDPCERRNLYRREYSRFFETQISRYRSGAVRPANARADHRANPRLWNGTWTNWGDYQDSVL